MIVIIWTDNRNPIMKKHTTIFTFFLLLGTISLFAQDLTPTESLIANNPLQKVIQVEPTKSISVGQLIPGQQYMVQFIIEDDESCLPIASMNIPYEISRETAELFLLDFKATRSTEQIFLKTPCVNNPINNYLISTQCITCPYEPSAAARFEPVIQAEAGVEAEVLIRDYFVAGGCYEVENIAHTGPAISRGVFSQGEIIGFDEGVILATGDVQNSSGPNQETGTTTQFSGNQGDRDLNTLLRVLGSSLTSTQDVSVLEFDFTPTSDKVSFEYVFASEEYCDFSNSEFNDVFGFFISGPGINGPFTDGGINIAKLPGTSTFVSINSVNWQNNRPFYNNNTPGLRALGNCSLGEVFAAAVAKQEMEYDGFTDVLTAEADVIPCETYHIKLAVGDVGDKKFDSAVFLAANSFKLGDPAELATEIPNASFPDSNLVYESCQESFFVFKRTEDSDRTKPQVVPFTISDLSTAEPNVDYTAIPSPVIIPIGQDSIKVPVNVFDDGIAEGPESIIFELESACTCEDILTELVIAEPAEPIVTFEELSTCPGGTVNITPMVEGGVGEYTYEWSNQETAETIAMSIDEATTYFVTVTDECGTTSIGEVNVGIEPQVATLSGAVVVCNGEPSGEIEVNFTGSGPYSLEYEFNGETRNISNIETATYILPETAGGTYEAIGMMSSGCVGTGEGTAEIIETNVVIEYKFGNPKCNKTTDGFIELTMDEAEANYTYDWDNGATGSRLDDLEEGEYSVIVSNELGCTDTEFFTLTKPEQLTTELTVSGIANCYTPNGGSIDLEVAGGSPGYAYAWSNGAGIEEDPNNLEGGIYEVKVTDANGCETTATAEIQADLAQPDAKIQVAEIINCLNNELTLAAVGTSLGDEFSYEWTTDDGNILTNSTNLTPTVNAGGTYQLTVINADNGCQTVVSEVVEEDRVQPEMEITAPTQLNCKDITQQLEGILLEDLTDYTALWRSNNGNFITDQDILTPAIDQPGTYSLMITNNINGCVIEKNVTVEQDIQEPEVAIVAPADLNCSRNTVSIQTEVAMEENEYEYNWQTLDGRFLDNRTTLTPTVDRAGLYTLKVTNISNFCETTVEARVRIDTLSPKIDAGETAIFTCDKKEISLNGTVADNRPYNFIWTTEDGGILSGEKSLTPAINEAGTYTLFVKDELNDCEATDLVVITDDINRPKAIIENPDAITCTNQTVQLNAENSTQGTNINYRWETFSGNILDASNPINPVMGAAGTYLLFVVDETNGCEGKGLVEILIDTITPTASIAAAEVFNCNSTTALIDGSASSTGANFSYDWTTTDGTIISKTDINSPTIGSAGTYQVEILNTINGCTATASLSIIDEKPTDLSLAIDQPLCHGDKGQANVVDVIGGVGPYTYSIDGGNRFHNEAGFTALRPGVYDFIIKDANNCELAQSIEIVEPEELVVKLGDQLELQLGDSMNLSALTNIPEENIAEIVWTPAEGLSCDDCLNPIAKPFQSINYAVEIIDQNGCMASSDVNLMVDLTPHIFVPNVFRQLDSQAGNDRFTIFAKDGMVNQIVTLEIYNRWGETVYQRKNFVPNDPSLGWDGFFDRQRMKPAVFVYRAEVEMIDGRNIQIQGDFTLMR